MRIAVVGAGHAGVEAARAACQAGGEVVLFSAEAVPPYFRPRLPSVAFGLEAQAGVQMKPPAFYAKQAIDLRLDAPVTSLDPATGTVVARGASEAFDAVVLALGAGPFLPPFAAGCPGRVLPLWTAAQAATIRGLVQPGLHVVVVGGGILGLEAALRAREAGLQATVIEKLERLMPMQFGARASAFLLRRIEARGIDVRLGRSVLSSQPDASGSRVRLDLDDGTRLEPDFCVVAIGSRPATGLAAAVGLSVERGVRVDRHLRTSAERVLAAGDAVQFEGVTRCSVREAVAQGRVAGANAAAVVRGEPLTEYAPEFAPLTFKSKDIELYALGDPGSPGCVEWSPDASTNEVIRTVVLRDRRAVGVQMIGTKQDLDDYVEKVRTGAALADGDATRSATGGSQP